MMSTFNIWGLLLLYTFHAVSLSYLCPSKYSPKKTFAIWTGMVVISTGVSVSLIYFLPAPLGINLSYFVTALVIIGVEYLVSQEQFSKTLFFLLTYAQVFTLMLFLSGLLAFQFWNENYTAKMMVFMALHLSLTILCVILSKGRLKYISQGLVNGWWPLNFLSILLLIYLGYISLRVYSSTYRAAETVFFVLLLVIIIAVYMVFFHTIHFMYSAAEKQRAELQNQFLLRQMDTMKESIDEARRIRHDFRHHNMQMREYLQNREYDALQRYLGEYEKETQNQYMARICDNLAANSILSAYTQKAKQDGIAVNLNVTMDRDVGINDIDIVAILANLMENAINGCLKSHKPNQSIDVYIGYKAKKLVINISNTAREDVAFQEGLPRSKSGIGVTSILHSASKYGGEYNFRNENGQFVCEILLSVSEYSQQNNDRLKKMFSITE